MRTLPPLVLLFLAACSSNWKFVSAENHPALSDGAQIATFERGRGAEHERKFDLRVDGKDIDAPTTDVVMDHARPIDSVDAAIAYSALVRELGVVDAGVRGLIVRPDPTIEGPGSSGRYSRADAAIWRIDFLPTGRPYSGGYEVTRVVLLPPMPHPFMPKVMTPWRLLQIREVVFKDGTIKTVDEKTLSDGQDAVRFAEH
jgi:hypothetical protein